MYFSNKNSPEKEVEFENKHGSYSYPIKIWGKSVKGFLSYYQTNKQTSKESDKQRLLLYIFDKSQEFLTLSYASPLGIFFDKNSGNLNDYTL